MFPNYVWDIATTNKELYLTFDDGPTPEITNWTLDILKHYNAKATFFCIGNNFGVVATLGAAVYVGRFGGTTGWSSTGGDPKTISETTW